VSFVGTGVPRAELMEDGRVVVRRLIAGEEHAHVQ
jgi:hypothetical protein